MSKPRKMPSNAAIWSHWNQELKDKYNKYWLIDLRFGEKRNDKNFVCFACGAIAQLQRCHILADNLGGSSNVDNLHLLCKPCHDESEFLSGDLYFKWFSRKTIGDSAHWKAMDTKMILLYESIRECKEEVDFPEEVNFLKAKLGAKQWEDFCIACFWGIVKIEDFKTYLNPQYAKQVVNHYTQNYRNKAE